MDFTPNTLTFQPLSTPRSYLTPIQRHMVATSKERDGNMPKDFEYRGYYISLLPLGTTRPLYHVSVYQGDNGLWSTQKASYTSAIDLAKQFVDNFENQRMAA